VVCGCDEQNTFQTIQQIKKHKKQQIFDPNALKKDGSGSLILIWVLANFDV
jgi:hypothetical protein